jgi:UPF0755 protein
VIGGPRLAGVIEGLRDRPILVMLLSAGLTLASFAVIATLISVFLVFAPGPARTDTTVVLRRGAGVVEMGATLAREHVIYSAGAFRLAAQATGADRKLKPGEYEFSRGVSLAGVLRKMAAGEVVRHYVTIPEGKTSAQAVAILNDEPELIGQVTVPPEGSIMPDTYEVTRGETRAEVIEQMRAEHDALLADLWPRRQPGLPFATPQEAVTLASIVEKETGVPVERSRVASVFVNRLRKGMRLESDPTVIYAVSRGEPLGRGLRQSELLAPSPYNTYFTAGLPPTPIANPGRAALEAVLDPARTQDLYFVANGTGGHSFAATLEEHAKNVARWRQIEAAAKKPPASSAPPPPALRGALRGAR